MNLLFAIDKRFSALFLNCIASIVRSGGAEQYTAYILHSDLDEADQEALRVGVPACVTCNFIAIDEAMFEQFPESDRYPKQIYYRIAAPLLLPRELDRILYLDVDTVVINPLCELYETDFEGAYYIACTHIRKLLNTFNRVRLGIEEEVPYINTGVMLLNLPALRENLRLDEVQDYVNEKRKALLLPDQDIITALYGDKIKLVDSLRYNLSDRILALYNADPRNEKIDLDWVRKNTVIIHYCGKNKPWKDSYIGVLGEFCRISS